MRAVVQDRYGAVDEVLHLSKRQPGHPAYALAALAECAACDGRLRPVGAEMIRAVVESPECPLPPFVGLPDARGAIESSFP